MALTTKTITVVIPTETTSVASNTRLDFASVTVTIPETASRTFKSVAIKVYARDDETSTKYISNVLIGCKLGSTAADDATLVSSAFNQYSQFEHMGAHFVRTDAALVAYFNNNFGNGTTQTMQVSFKIQTCATINQSAVVEITYEYDDASVTTVNAMAYIPLDGSTSLLTSSLAALVASNNLPALTGTGSILDGLNSVSIKRATLIITAQEAPTATTDFQLGTQIDANAEVLDAVHRQNQQSGVFYQYALDVSSVDWSTTHTLNVRSTVASRMNLTNALLVIHFTYDWSASSVAWCGLRLPLITEEGLGASATSGDRAVLWLDFDVEDPATLSMQQSGIALSFVQSYRTGWTLNCLVGSQTARAYTSTIGSSFSTVPVGMTTLMQRFDSGGAQGSGLTLARGKNSLRVGFYSGTTEPRVGGFSAIAYLNYRCGKASSEGKQTRTLYHGVLSTSLQSGGTNVRTVASVQPSITPSSYAVVNAAVDFGSQIYSGNVAVCVHAERLVGEGIADGWQALFGTMYTTGTGGQLCARYTQSVGSYFNRWTNDIDTTRLVLTASRQWRFITTIDDSLFDAGLYITVHGYTFTVADTITGLSAPVAGNIVDIHLAPSEDPTSPRIASTTTDSDGNFTATVHDNTRDVFAKIVQSSTKLGLSYTGKAS